jgi:hypothetical protein
MTRCVVAYDLVCIHKSFIIPNTLQKLNFLQHIHIESRQCVAVVARTLCDAICWARYYAIHGTFHCLLCALNFRGQKKENSARRSPESFPFFRCACNCCGRFETLCACVHGGLRIHGAARKILFVTHFSIKRVSLGCCCCCCCG